MDGGGSRGEGSVTRDALAGAAAGCLATVAMTGLMEPGLPGLLGRRWRPREFVPKQVVRRLDDATGGRQLRRGSRRESLAAAAAHLAYGAAAGAVYGVLRARVAGRGGSPWRTGPLYGLLTWLGGYQGWMPWAGVRPATTDHPFTQWPVPIANHLLYGTVLAHLFDRTTDRATRSTTDRRERFDG